MYGGGDLHPLISNSWPIPIGLGLREIQQFVGTLVGTYAEVGKQTMLAAIVNIKAKAIAVVFFPTRGIFFFCGFTL